MLNNKDFLIVYQEQKNIRFCKLSFHDVNFLHLTGIKSAFSALKFYNACISNKLSINAFRFDKGGKVQQKLYVLPFLSRLLYNNCMIGPFINSGISIRADYFVGNTKAIISVGFRQAYGMDIPVSLYQEDIRKLSHPTCKVLGIFPNRTPINYSISALINPKDIMIFCLFFTVAFHIFFIYNI